MERSGEVGEKRCVAVFWISCTGWKEPRAQRRPQRKAKKSVTEPESPAVCVAQTHAVSVWVWSCIDVVVLQVAALLSRASVMKWSFTARVSPKPY